VVHLPEVVDGRPHTCAEEHSMRLFVAHRHPVDADEPDALLNLEGLELSAVDPGSYDLYCLPLRLVGSDGAPARAILVRR
jgi:kynurenine formamidase